MSFVLVLFLYAGALSDGDSVAVTHVAMPSLAVCQREGQRAEALTRATKKAARFVCLDLREGAAGASPGGAGGIPK